MPSLTLTGALGTIEVVSDHGLWLLGLEELAAPLLERTTNGKVGWHLDLTAQDTAATLQTFHGWRRTKKEDRRVLDLQPNNIRGYWYDDAMHTRFAFRTRKRISLASLDAQTRRLGITLDPESRNATALLFVALRDTYRRLAVEAVPSRVFAQSYVTAGQKAVAWLPGAGLRQQFTGAVTAANAACVDIDSLLTHGLPRRRGDDERPLLLSKPPVTLTAIAIADPQLATTSAPVSLTAAKDWLQNHLLAPMDDMYALLQNYDATAAKAKATQRLLQLPWLAVRVARDWQEPGKLTAAARKPV